MEQRARFAEGIVTAIANALERYIARIESSDRSVPAQSAPIQPAIDEIAAADPVLRSLVQSFGLSRFERDLVLFCFAAELSPSIDLLCARAQGNQKRAFPTFSIAQNLFAEPHWDAIAPIAPLRKWHLLEIGHGDTLWTHPLRLDERILHFLLGSPSIDKRLADLLVCDESIASLTTSRIQTAERIVAILALASSPAPVIQLHGPDADGIQSIVRTAASAMNLPLYLLPIDNIPNGIEEQLGIALLWDRETILGSGILAIDCTTTERGTLSAAAMLMERLKSPILSISREPLRLGGRNVIPVNVAIPSVNEQYELWSGFLAQSIPAETIKTIVSQFNLSSTHIRSIGDEIAGMRPAESAAELSDELWDACRRQSRRHMEGLAHRIEPKADWNDLILPHAQKETLRQIAGHVRQRMKVYQEWGFGSRSGRGLGIAALFAGASGTGKTMSAEVLANELKLDLYQIDLSQMVSKYIGETEKNLRKIFDAADESGAILLFDEADALFGKRSEVKDSHDRYANLEVSYLLQRMESYRGLAILTTNMKQALDTAFLRRIRFIVNYPFPEPTERAEIWWRTIPSGTPTQGLDFAKLAALNVSGGSIWNIALNAAFLAADGGEPLRMKHMLLAARSEYAKLEKQLTDAEVRGWN